MRSAFAAGVILLAATVSGCTPGTSRHHDNLVATSKAMAAKMAEYGGSYLQSHSEEELIEAAKSSVREQLRDPESAQFRNVRVRPYEGGSIVCGEVNGKNAYGGYVGFKPFIAASASAYIESSTSRYDDVNQAANAGIYSACYGVG